jgi:hypothetical protein
MIGVDDFWSNWWNEDWHGKPKYSEKTYPSATLSTTKSHMLRPGFEPDILWYYKESSHIPDEEQVFCCFYIEN